MIFDLIMNTVGAVISMVNDERAVALLAAAGFVLGFVICSIWIFSIKCSKSQGH